MSKQSCICIYLKLKLKAAIVKQLLPNRDQTPENKAINSRTIYQQQDYMTARTG